MICCLLLQKKISYLLIKFINTITRSATKDNYQLPKVHTNYGKFNIRFSGPVIWNSIDKKYKPKKS